MFVRTLKRGNAFVLVTDIFDIVKNCAMPVPLTYMCGCSSLSRCLVLFACSVAPSNCTMMPSVPLIVTIAM